MNEGTILQVFQQIMGAFAPAINIMIAIVVAGLGLRWIIRNFMK